MCYDYHTHLISTFFVKSYIMTFRSPIQFDMNGSRGRLRQNGLQGCNHIATNLGPHTALTQWV